MSMHEHGYLIVKRDLYYMPNCQGYTGIRDQAGRYSLEFVERHCDPDFGLTFVHESEAPEFRDAAFHDLVIAHLLKQRAQARAEGFRAGQEAMREKAAVAASKWDGAPIRPHEAWTDEQKEWHINGQMDATSSVEYAIRALTIEEVK